MSCCSLEQEPSLTVSSTNEVCTGARFRGGTHIAANKAPKVNFSRENQRGCFQPFSDMLFLTISTTYLFRKWNAK